MSHLSQIKTSISSIKILKKTLDDYGFSYEHDSSIQNSVKSICKQDIVVKKDGKNIFTLKWDGSKYFLLTDLEFWDFDTPCERLLEKITQQYSYNSIIEESTKYGFISTNKQVLQDGSFKLTLKKWN
uniref:hypothetical protein n=1 Tax=Caulacanthus ustulatus TaxID=31411 RepID=UPI0027DA7706|nr:hypothetical protein REQ00_pgp193 [Caulacanthus ustulatus]WCH57232.1 hypothetical protein [Caulacanthus ustulatus]